MPPDVERNRFNSVESDWKERFLRLRDENLQLKRKKNEHEDTIKRMYTKLNVLEEQLKTRAARRARGAEAKDSEPNGVGNPQQRRDLVQADHSIQTLKQENATLRSESHYLRERNRSIEMKLRIRSGRCAKPHPFLSSRNHNTATSKKAKSRTTTKKVGGRRTDDSHSPRRTNRAENLGQSGVRPPLKILVKQKLRATGEKKASQILLESNQQILDENREEGESLSDPEDNGPRKKTSRSHVAHLKDELRDRQAQIAILNARYENLEYKYTVQRELQEKTIEENEYLNHQIHKLRGQLHDLMVEKEELKVQSAKAQEAEREVTLVREQNRKLEDKLTVLCESPFINDAFERKERIDRLFELEKVSDEQDARITAQNEDIKRYKGLNTDLKSQLARIKETKRLLEEELEETTRHIIQDRHSYIRSATPTSLTINRTSQEESKHSQKQRMDTHDACSSPLPSSPRDVSQLEEKTKPSISINVSASAFNSLDSAQLVNDLTAASEYSSVRHLRNRIHTLQLAHSKSLQELERSERMLEVQTNINRELVTEIQDLTSRKIGSTQLLQKKVQEAEACAQQRDNLIRDLKDRVRKLSNQLENYATKRNDDKIDTTNLEETMSDTVSISESLAELARDLAPGQQVLEIYVRKAQLDKGVWKEIDEYPRISCAEDYDDGSAVATFILCDFYDFESQSTALLKGYSPAYNTAMTFIITTDAFFLRFLASETLRFELYQAVHSDFRLVGQCDFPLHTLLTSYSEAIKCPKLLVRGVHQRVRDVTLGSLDVELRLSSGLYDIWKLHIQPFPADRDLITLSSDKDTSNLESVDFTERKAQSMDSKSDAATNDLEICVLSCRNLSLLRYRDESELKSPSAYVHYQLLDYPDTFTGICANSRDPVFDSCNRQTYTIKIDSSVLHFLNSSSLLFSVFDDNVQHVEDGDDHVQFDGMIGKVNILLQALARGDSVNQWFSLSDSRGCPAGEIRLQLNWYDPMRVAALATRALPVDSSMDKSLEALNVEQLYKLMEIFSPEADGRIQYVHFSQFALPTEAFGILCARLRGQLEALIDSQRIHSLEHLMHDVTGTFASSGLNNTAGSSRYVDWCDIIHRLESVGIYFSTNEIQTLRVGLQSVLVNIAATGIVDRAENSVFLPYLFLAFNPKLEAEIRLLQQISHERLRSYRDKTQENPINVFRRYDVQGSGYVSRNDFKSALAQLGFMVFDQDYMQLISSMKKESKMNNEDANATCSQRKSLALNKAKIVCGSSRAKSLTVNDETTDLSTVSGEHMCTTTSQSRLKSEKTTHLSINADFARRKEMFRKRMNALTAGSSQSYVYEYLEKRGLDAKEKATASIGDHTQTRRPEYTDPVQESRQLKQDAAISVQRVFRGYRSRHQLQTVGNLEDDGLNSVSKVSLLEADQHLHLLFRHFTSRDFKQLSRELNASLAQFPRSQQEPFTKKQTTYFLSRIPHLTLEPSQIQVLIQYFSSKHSDCVAVEALFHFIITARAPWTFSTIKNASIIECFTMLDTIVLNMPRIIDVFEKTGDFKRSGVITVGRFREVLHRISLINESVNSISFQTLLFLTDSGAGTHFLYNAILRCIFSSNATKKVHNSLQRLGSFGILGLRQQLYMDAPVDGMLTLEHFSRILMQQKTQDDPPRPAFLSVDAAILFSLHSSHLECGLSIDSLVGTLEQALKAESIRDAFESQLTYSLTQVQAICQNAVQLFNLKKSELLERFERFDWKQRGIVSLLEFRYVTSEELTSGDVPCAGMPFSMFLTKKQVEMQIAKAFGSRVKERFGINYREFVDWIQYTGLDLGLPPKEILRCNADEMDVIESRLRAYAQSPIQESKASDTLGSWRQTFATADTTQLGYLSRASFAHCTAKLQLPLDQQALRLILYFYDRFARDEVRYEEFLQLNWREGVNEEKKHGAKVLSRDPHLMETIEGEESRLQVDPSKLMLGIRTYLMKMSPSELKQRVEKIHRESDDTELRLCSEVAFTKWMQLLGSSLSPYEAHAIFELYENENKLVEGRLLDFHDFLLGLLGYDLYLSTAETVDIQSDNLKVVLDKLMALFYGKAYREPTSKDVELFVQFCNEHHVKSVSMSEIWDHLRCSEKFRGLQHELARLMQAFSICCEGDTETLQLEAVWLQKVCCFLKNNRGERMPSCTAPNSSISPSIDPERDVTLNLRPDNPLLHSLARLVEAKELDGDDLFGEFEAIDTTHTGCIRATDFRDVLLRAGLADYIADILQQNDLSAFDNAMGVFVRQYRLPYQDNMIQFVVMLHHAMNPKLVLPKLWGPLQAQERLRSFLRQKAGLQGPIIDYQADETLYGQLDNAFYHLDLERKGYLTIDDLENGMMALLDTVDSTATQLINQSMGLFRNQRSSGRISRMEFDAFVMDPRAEHLIQRLTDQLCWIGENVNLLEHSCKAFDSNDLGLIPTADFCIMLTDALLEGEELLPFDHYRLEHIFDTRRNRSIAYKLFLKVIIQYRHNGATSSHNDI
uniref:Uncharacterized protein AlNc14C2G297 n=1 Tax=Albugo laibachii Nc14 TaxID=890382 RepID=F0VZF9_9STRA|nr:conserved hypothetical protein [Albugo laibachii Nc14]|eukprot:CCA14189.1 conserved hypothetical protein [Albugo laibachii Nc14]